MPNGPYFDVAFTVWSPGAIADQLTGRFRRLGLADRIEHLPALPTPGDPRIGVFLSHRRAVETARERNLDTVLVLSADAIFLDTAAQIMERAAAELSRREWAVLYLGGMWPFLLEPEPGCLHLDRALDVTKAPAIAYHRGTFAKVLPDWPSEAAAYQEWLELHGDLDRYLKKLGPSFAVHPVVASTPALLPFETAAAQSHFKL
jgi:hypothetical protein